MIQSPDERNYLKKKKLELLERKAFLKENLPFMPGPNGLGCNLHPLYQWQEDFITSTNQLNFVTSGNQVGKSSAGIIKCLRWGYQRELWPKLWPNHTPNLFFYYYPDRGTSDREFKTKWQKYLPQKALKDDPYWGWKETKDKNGQIDSIRLNTGIVIYFITYTQTPANVQASTVDAAFADEEMPLNHFSECQLRASRGFYHNFFTATIGQPYLFSTMERQGKTDENFPTAFKRQISMYDCLVYSDGTKSEHITKEYIEERKASLPDEKEILKRIYGRFVKTEGLRFQSFEYDRNVSKHHPLPRSWQIYVGVDFGSGGELNHPSSIVFVGVSPDFMKARVFKSWVGHGIKTTQGDLIEKYIELSNGLAITSVYYDYSATDLGEIAGRLGLPFCKADKSHDGIALINTLFKNEQLKVFHDQHDLIAELQTVPDKKDADGDDATDALRYALALVPFQLQILTQQDSEDDEEVDPYKDMDPRMRFYKGIDRDPMNTQQDNVEQDINEIAEMFESGGF